MAMRECQSRRGLTVEWRSSSVCFCMALGVNSCVTFTSTFYTSDDIGNGWPGNR